MMRKLLFTILFLFIICSCKESGADKAIRLVKEWNNKEIIYPTQMHFIALGQDSIETHFTQNNKYSIITYVDSIGCTSCKLQLKEWKTFIAELDSLTTYSVPVYLFLHPHNKKEMLAVLKREQFNHPVCIDEQDSLNLLNKFPQEMSFQTFLLDQKNKVIAIGNPVHNPKIKELYLNTILGKRSTTSNKENLTTASLQNNLIDMGDFDWKQEQIADVTLANSGQTYLVINDITTSCGCTIVEYPKQPIPSRESATLRIKYKADHPEHFSKTIAIHCNTGNSPIQLKISGNAK